MRQVAELDRTQAAWGLFLFSGAQFLGQRSTHGFTQRKTFKKNPARSKPPCFQLVSLGYVHSSHVPIRCRIQQEDLQRKLTSKGVVHLPPNEAK